MGFFKKKSVNGEEGAGVASVISPGRLPSPAALNKFHQKNIDRCLESDPVHLQNQGWDFPFYI